MKFLVLATPGAPPPAGLAPQLLRAMPPWIEEQHASGVVDVVYAFPGGGGCAIANADTAERLNQLLLSAPLGPFTMYDVRPLADFTEAMQAAASVFDNAAGPYTAKPGGQ